MWSSDVLFPSFEDGRTAEVIGLTPSLSEAFVQTKAPGEAPGMELLARSAIDGALSTLVPLTAALEPRFVGASEDGSLVVFESPAVLPASGPAIAGGPNLYALNRFSGQVRLIALFNDGGAPLEGGIGGSYDWILGATEGALGQGGSTRNYYTQDQHVVSANGSAVYFTAAGTGELYLRRNPGSAQAPLDGDGNCAGTALACTVHVSASQRTNGPPPVGPGTAAFMGASADGTEVFFTSAEELTDDAHTGPDPIPPTIARAAIDGSPPSIESGFLPVSAAGLAVDGSNLYWADPLRGSIGRANIDGSGVNEDFIGGLVRPRWVAIDDEYVYWTSPGGSGNPSGGTIGRARLDGGGTPEPDFITGAGRPQGVAVTETKIFWANDAAPAIARANIDGSGIESSFHPLGAAEVPQGVVVNDSHIYWTENEPSGYVSRSNLDGSGETYRFIGATEELRGLAIDGKYVYWAAQGGGAIGRISLDLNETEPKIISAAGRATGLAVDGAHLYWSTGRTASPGNDLYRYDADTGELTDLVADPAAVNGADVQGVIGVSEVGSYVYFVANGVLAGAPNHRGETALPGTCEGNLGATTGTCNLYVSHDGVVDFIARLEIDGGAAISDAASWAATPTGVFNSPNFQQTARVSDDGRTLLFRSQRPLTGYASGGIPELFRYHAGDEDLTCISCDPSGAATAGAPTLGSIAPPSRFRGRPPATAMTRNLSADGDRVFFESVDPLVEADHNGDDGCPLVGLFAQRFPACQDVYEWEAEGSGSCASATANGGCLYLLSTSQPGQPAFFADASKDGDDVFLFTRAQLVDQDVDDFVDVYDARVDGGLAGQNEAPSGCEEEGCRLPPGVSPAGETLGTAGPPRYGPPRSLRGCSRTRHTKHRHARRCGKRRRHRG
jgi:sugar lactone lactonase YvrE